MTRSNQEFEGLVRSADGTAIAYTFRGTGEPALVFIHGGFADRTFWRPQIDALSEDHRVVALDLAGHGGSGRNREAWTIVAFAEDVRSVVEALAPKRAVLIGNSLGGPVALEAARLLRGVAIGVVGVDTLHDATVTIDHAHARARAAAFRTDPAGACHAMVEALFHPNTYPELRAWAEKRMSAMPPGISAPMMEGFGGYDMAKALRGAGVPIRVINGDLWPTSIERNRAVVDDFGAVVMTGAGHYPMLERPDEFNRLLVEIVDRLSAGTAGTAGR